MDSELYDYVSAHISPEPEQLQRLWRRTNIEQVYAHMCTDHIQGRLLKMLTQMIAPMRILELGAFTGYSTLCIAEGMPQGASLHTVEIDDEQADGLLREFEASGRAADIHLHIGDALEVVPQLGGEWDMAVIDANKRHYVEYYEMILPMMRRGGYILADNTLWGGKIAGDAHDSQTEGIRRFNNLVASDTRVEKVIIPVRDGLTLIRVL